MTLRPFQSADLERVVSLWYDTWHQTFPGLTHPHPLALWKQRFHQDFVNQASIWVAECSGIVVGFMVVMMAQQSLEQIFVDPHFQHRGIGSLLLSKAKALCPQGLRLRTLQQNQAASAFYEQHDFLPSGLGVNKVNHQPDVEYTWRPALPCEHGKGRHGQPTDPVIQIESRAPWKKPLIMRGLRRTRFTASRSSSRRCGLLKQQTLRSSTPLRYCQRPSPGFSSGAYASKRSR
jgi:putative acetyltransferase